MFANIRKKVWKYLQNYQTNQFFLVLKIANISSLKFIFSFTEILKLIIQKKVQILKDRWKTVEFRTLWKWRVLDVFFWDFLWRFQHSFDNEPGWLTFDCPTAFFFGRISNLSFQLIFLAIFFKLIVNLLFKLWYFLPVMKNLIRKCHATQKTPQFIFFNVFIQ